ncbi:MAG TPA: RluA family pseudouridine synthase [Bacteroidota bacterium]|nr:RluA family pseudouridine synthase [Bacteroidota bacterium]
MTSEEHRSLQITVPQGEHPKRIDVYLAHQIENATRTKVQEAIENGNVLVNGKSVKPSYQIAPNDCIEITIPKPPRIEAVPENIPLDIVYEDDVLLIVNKPAGMVTHPAYGNYSGTLVNALLYHCNNLSTVNTELRPGIVHRLDKDTSGLLVVAKNNAAHHYLARQFSAHTIEREYWAIVWGAFKNPKGIIEANLGRSKKDRKKVAVVENGKQAITEYEVLENWQYHTLLRLHLKTGRTHQIRVHLAHIGHPVFGDPTYGGRNPAWGGITGKHLQFTSQLLKHISRQALHAKTLGFQHPVTHKFVQFNSQLPADMEEVLHLLNSQK